jgi:hypothetical protein
MFVDSYNHFYKPNDCFINHRCYYPNMRWNKRNKRFSKSQRRGFDGAFVALSPALKTAFMAQDPWRWALR